MTREPNLTPLHCREVLRKMARESPSSRSKSNKRRIPTNPPLRMILKSASRETSALQSQENDTIYTLLPAVAEVINT